jgi:hypothetical protein
VGLDAPAVEMSLLWHDARVGEEEASRLMTQFVSDAIDYWPDEYACGLHERCTNSIGTRIRMLRGGIKYRYPLCCSLRFALAFRQCRAMRRGGCDNGPERFPEEGFLGDRSVYVPCGIFHTHDADMPPMECRCEPAPERTRFMGEFAFFGCASFLIVACMFFQI